MATSYTDEFEHFRNPPPGSAAAAARDFGIDLTLLIENLRLTPEQRVRQGEAYAIEFEKIRGIASRCRPDGKTRKTTKITG